MSLSCAADGCERRAIRTRSGQRWCLFHPDSEPPPDKPVAVAHAPLSKPKPRPEPEAAPSEPCSRTEGCTKQAGHLGRCPGPRRSSVRGRTVQIPVRFTPVEADGVRSKARAAGLTLNDYLRGRILGAQEGPPL